MTTINRLSEITSAEGSDQLPVFDQSSGVARKMPLSTLLAYMQEYLDFTGADDFTTQYAAPNTTGTNININSGTESIHLILTPTAAFSSLGLVLPESAIAVDKQQVLVNSTQAITTVIINGNGATVTGAPASLATNGFFKLKYDKPTNVWYRVG